MFRIEQAQYLATREIILHAGNQPSALKSRKGSQPATVSSPNGFLPVSERLGLQETLSAGLEYHRDSDELSGGNGGPIIQTPMGIVRPWPRNGERSSEGLDATEAGDGTTGYGESPGMNGLPSHEDTKRPREPQRPHVEDGRSPLVTDGDQEPSGSESGHAPIIETPMGTVKPTKTWRRFDRHRSEGDVDAIIPHEKHFLRLDDEGSRSKETRQIETHTKAPKNNDANGQRDEKQITKLHIQCVRAAKTGPRHPGTERNGNGTNGPAKPPMRNGEREASLERTSLTNTPSKDTPPLKKVHNDMVSTALRDIVDKFLINNRKFPRTPAEACPLDCQPQLSSSIDLPTAQNTSEPSELINNITTLTLLTENMRALTTFYVTVLGATLASSTATSSTLTFTPQLSVRLVCSKFARDRAVFGEDVVVARQAATPKRVMLGVEVRDADVVWRQLRKFGHGQGKDDGQETLGEVRVVEGRRTVCFVDLSGHCWEAWQRVVKEGDGDSLGLVQQ